MTNFIRNASVTLGIALHRRRFHSFGQKLFRRQWSDLPTRTLPKNLDWFIGADASKREWTNLVPLALPMGWKEKYVNYQWKLDRRNYRLCKDLRNAIRER